MSKTTLTFADGGNAVLRDPKLVPVKVRRVWERANAPLASIKLEIENELTDETAVNKEFQRRAMGHMADIDASVDAAVLALVEQWTYGDINGDVLENLPAETYDKLAEECQKLAPQMRPNFKPEQDPKAVGSDGTANTPEFGV